MFKLLIFIVILTSPSELFKKAHKSLGSDLEEAQLYLDSIKSLSLSDFEEAKLYNFQGYIRGREKNISSALLNYFEALRYLKASGNKSDDARYMYMNLYNNIAEVYYHFSDQELAIKYYNESLEYAQDSIKATVLFHLALSQDKLGQSEEAIDNLLDAFKYAVEYDQKDVKAPIQIKIGIILRKIGEYSTALEHLNDVIVSAGISDHDLAVAHNNYAITTWEMGDYSTAEMHFKNTLEIGNSYNQFVALQNLCEMYLEQGHLYKCIEAGTKAEEQFASQINNPENMILFSYLSQAYKSLGNFEQALAYSNHFNSGMVDYYDEQLSSVDADEAYRIKMVTENYQLKLQQIEERKMTILINIIISSIILLTFLTLIWRQQSKKKKMVEKITEELLA